MTISCGQLRQGLSGVEAYVQGGPQCVALRWGVGGEGGPEAGKGRD